MPRWQGAKSACRVTAQEMAWVHCCGRRRPRQTLTSMSRRFPTTRSLCSRVSRAVKLYCSLGRIGVGVCNRTTSEHAQVRVLTRCFRSGPADQDSLCLQFIQRSVRHEAVIARVSPPSTVVDSTTSCSTSSVHSLLRSAFDIAQRNSRIRERHWRDDGGLGTRIELAREPDSQSRAMHAVRRASEWTPFSVLATLKCAPLVHKPARTGVHLRSPLYRSLRRCSLSHIGPL